MTAIVVCEMFKVAGNYEIGGKGEKKCANSGCVWVGWNKEGFKWND